MGSPTSRSFPPGNRARSHGSDAGIVHTGLAYNSPPMSLRSAILQAIDGRAETLTQLARRIHENPELRMQEHQAARWLAAEVEGAGVPVERSVGGLSTAF